MDAVDAEVVVDSAVVEAIAGAEEDAAVPMCRCREDKETVTVVSAEVVVAIAVVVVVVVNSNTTINDVHSY